MRPEDGRDLRGRRGGSDRWLRSGRLRRPPGAVFRGKAVTLHAVSTGNRVEPLTLSAMASVGGGSLWHIDAGHPPAAVARELIQGMLAPGLQGLKVEFPGIRTACVYPESLSNLAHGLNT